MLTTIPFAGLYCSWHDDALDRACESVLQDDQGEPVHDKLPMKLFDAIDWGKAHTEYAQMYAKAWCDHLGIQGMEFDELNSPREYNFATDRIFVRIPQAEVERIHTALAKHPQILTDLAKSKFTSRSGFHSFYSPDVSDWGPLETWDHNQVGTLLEAFQEMEEPGFEESSLTEDWNCNGWLDNMILNTPEAVRVANLAYRVRRMRGEV